MPSYRAFNWGNITFLTLSPIAAFVSVGLYIYHQGLHPADLLSFWFLLLFTGLAITAGYHRYYSHRSYECHPVMQVFYLLFGAAALQTSVLHWASDHRFHHRFVDHEGDPYNITKGFFWAHMGWIFYKDIPPRSLENVPDLKADRLVMWQHRYHLPLGIGVGFILPFLIGIAFGRPWGGFLWGGLLRVVLGHHGTFLINSAGHYTGRQLYTDTDSSRGTSWLAFVTLGEGYHNFHHAFPGDYRNGVLRCDWDPTKWWIWGLSRIGLTWRLHRVPARSIQRAQMRMKHRQDLPLLEQKSRQGREV